MIKWTKLSLIKFSDESEGIVKNDSDFQFKWLNCHCQPWVRRAILERDRHITMDEGKRRSLVSNLTILMHLQSIFVNDSLNVMSSYPRPEESECLSKQVSLKLAPWLILIRSSHFTLVEKHLCRWLLVALTIKSACRGVAKKPGGSWLLANFLTSSWPLFAHFIWGPLVLFLFMKLPKLFLVLEYFHILLPLTFHIFPFPALLCHVCSI